MHLEALERVLSAFALVRQHAADGLVQNPRGGAEVVRTASGVRVHALVQVAHELDCKATVSAI